MREEIVISGSGGQGIMFLGKLIAQSALKADLKVTLLPAYGAEVRGGTSHCMVIISDKEIASPFIKKADTLIALNEPSLNKFKDRIKESGLLIVNSSLVEKKPQQAKNKHLVFFPFSDIATSLADIRVANVVALGAYILKKDIISLKGVTEALKENISPEKKELFLLNEKAIREGMRLDPRCWILDARRKQKRGSSIENRGSRL